MDTQSLCRRKDVKACDEACFCVPLVIVVACGPRAHTYPSVCLQTASSPPVSPSREGETQKERYERLREEAAKQGMRMLEEERERNREMNDLLKARVDDLEHG